MRTNDHYEAPYQVNGKRTVFTVLGIILCCVILLTSVFFIVVSAKDFDKGEIPFFFGWGVCSSDGVSGYIGKNELVVIREVSTEEIATGDVLVYYDASSGYDRSVFTGKVTQKDNDIVELSKKDGTDEVVSIKVTDIKGEARYSIAGLGTILSIVEGKYGLILSIALAILFVSVIILLFGSYFSQKEEKRMLLALENASDEIEQFTVKYSERGLIKQRKADDPSNGQNEAGEKEAVQPADTEVPQDTLKIGKAPMEDVPQEKEFIQQVVAAEVPPEQNVYEPALCLETKEAVQEADASASQQGNGDEEPKEQEAEEIQAILAVQAAMEARDVSTLQKEAAIISGQTEEVAQEVEKQVEESLVQQPEKQEQEAVLEEEEIVPVAKYSTIDGSFLNEKVEFTIDCSLEEGEALRKLISLAVEKSGRFGIFTSAGTVDGYRLKIWCEWDDMPFVSTLIKEFKKRK